jgi:hypothetical protein
MPAACPLCMSIEPSRNYVVAGCWSGKAKQSTCLGATILSWSPNLTTGNCVAHIELSFVVRIRRHHVCCPNSSPPRRLDGLD